MLAHSYYGPVMSSAATATQAHRVHSDLAASSRASVGARMAAHGALWALAGTGVVAVTYATADGAVAPYLVGAGAMAAGLVDLVRGLAARS